jgi:hypothetical protein
VGVNDGTNCITPDEATIADGSYPFTRELRINVNQSSLSDPVVQSLLWFIYSDSNYALFETSGLSGVPFGQLADIREELQTAFDTAVEAASSTEEPGATSEAGATAEVGATAEADATTEVDATDAVSATDEPSETEESTIEATADVTAEATES